MDTDTSHSELFQKVHAAANVIRTFTKRKPKVGIILGTGLGQLARSVKKSVVVPYGQIPHFPHTTVATHAGERVQIDTTRIMRGATGATVAWTRLQLGRELADPGGAYTSVQAMNRYDCAGGISQFTPNSAKRTISTASTARTGRRAARWIVHDVGAGDATSSV